MQFWRDIIEYYKVDKPSFLFALILISVVVGFFPQLPRIIVYAAMILYAARCFYKPHNIHLLLFLALIYIPIELLIAQPDPLFRSWERYAMFALLLGCVSPLFDGEYHRMARNRILNIVLYSCFLLGVGSFFAWFLGINFMTITKVDFINRVGLFGGLTPHSMLLGPIAGIGAIFSAYKGFISKNKLYWMCMALCLGAVMFSASRSALAATLAGVVTVVYRLSGNVSRFVNYAFIALLIASSTFQIWGGALDRVIKKNRGSTTELNITSREDKWLMRIQEFENNPMFGVGFVSVDIQNTDGSVMLETGVIETGSSWLSILSMLGLFGAIIVGIILVKSFLFLWNNEEPFYKMCLGVLTLFYVHMVAEGYIFSGGSFLCFVLWLIIGVAYDSQYCFLEEHE